MERAAYGDDSPIAACATVLAPSALAVLRVSGAGSLGLLTPLFSRPAALAAAASGQAVHGWLLDGEGRKIDEAVVLVWRAPAGYTGEEAADLMTHGSPCAVQAAMEALLSSGFRAALPGEFSLRAFAAGKLDLTRAEAVTELVQSRTDDARADAVRRLSGGLAELASRARERVADALAAAHVQLDYAEDDGVPDMALPRESLGESLEELEALLATWRSGRLLSQGARVAIGGRTNAGKSSLFNILLREDRALVSEIHGTTRDYLEAWLDVEGIPVLLQDTAGLREGVDALEAAGMERSRRLLAEAELVLWLVDSERGALPEDMAEIQALGQRCLPLWSRCDRAASAAPAGFLSLSCLSGEGLGELQAALARRLRGERPREAAGELRVAGERQRDCLARAAAALGQALDGDASGAPLDAVAAELRSCLDALGELTGETTDAEILESIFSRFCVGK